MLFGLSGNTPENDGSAHDAIFDVGTEEFEDRVMRTSMDTPVIVDFWAPWCGPCKQLGPVLEQAVTAAKGAVRMAKVNIDENPELAQALRVQSIPTVFAFFQGQPVTGFTGARPASDIKMLIDQLVKLSKQSKPDALNIPETLALAAQHVANGEFDAAQGLYAAILEQDEKNVQAYVALVRCFIAAGDVETAAELVTHAPDDIAQNPAFDAARAAVKLAESAPSGGAADAMADAIEKNPADHAARFDYAMALFGSGRKDDAMTQLLEIIRRDRTWEDDKARRQLLEFFDALGPSDPAVTAARRQLSSLLFS